MPLMQLSTGNGTSTELFSGPTGTGPAVWDVSCCHCQMPFRLMAALGSCRTRSGRGYSGLGALALTSAVHWVGRRQGAGFQPISASRSRIIVSRIGPSRWCGAALAAATTAARAAASASIPAPGCRCERVPRGERPGSREMTLRDGVFTILTIVEHAVSRATRKERRWLANTCIATRSADNAASRASRLQDAGGAVPRTHVAVSRALTMLDDGDTQALVFKGAWA